MYATAAARHGRRRRPRRPLLVLSGAVLVLLLAWLASHWLPSVFIPLAFYGLTSFCTVLMMGAYLARGR
jgi:peptidoglycan/LPS O-acetylase OafA/YrhL